MRWRLIKANFSRCIPKDEYIRESRRRKGERVIRQRRFGEHVIRDERDLERKVNYTHYNPVKHGYVKRVRDWPYSSFHWYVCRGWLPLDWGCTDDFEGDFAERSGSYRCRLG